MCEHSTDQSTEEPWLPALRLTKCGRAEASPWLLNPSVGLCNGDLEAPVPAKQQKWQHRVESRQGMCAHPLSREWKWQSLDSAKLSACSERCPAAELSTAPFSGTRKKSSTPTFQAMFASLPACSLFREGNATALLTHCTSLLKIYFICRAWSTGLEIRGRSKATVPVLQLCSSTLQQERPLRQGY